MASDDTEAVWQPSTWQPGMPATPSTADLSHLPMPTADHINQQRQAIAARLRHYGYPVPQLSDQQVLATMTNIPQGPVQWPDWVQDWFRRNPGADSVGGRPGVDTPTDATYEDWNLRQRGLSGALTNVGLAYAIPQAALVERYGQAAVDQMHADWVRNNSNPDANLDIRTDHGFMPSDPTAGAGYNTGRAPAIGAPAPAIGGT